MTPAPAFQIFDLTRRGEPAEEVANRMVFNGQSLMFPQDRDPQTGRVIIPVGARYNPNLLLPKLQAIGDYRERVIQDLESEPGAALARGEAWARMDHWRIYADTREACPHCLQTFYDVPGAGPMRVETEKEWWERNRHLHLPARRLDWFAQPHYWRPELPLGDWAQRAALCHKMIGRYGRRVHRFAFVSIHPHGEPDAFWPEQTIVWMAATLRDQGWDGLLMWGNSTTDRAIMPDYLAAVGKAVRP